MDGLIPNSYDRINYTIAISIKNNTNPTNNNAYASFLRKIYRSKFQVSQRIEKQEINIVISAWYGDRWCNNVEDSPYFNREETDNWKMKWKEH